MTAVATILNKNAIAIAADSAVTITGPNRQNIYNTANKIFTLSKYHPVAVAVYSSADFMGTPWEIIIKEYRKELGDNSFPTLQDYIDNFFSWFIGRPWFVNPELELDYIQDDFAAMVSFIIQLIDNQRNGDFFSNDELEFIFTDVEKYLTRNEFIPGLQRISKARCRNILGNELSEWASKFNETFENYYDVNYIQDKLLTCFWHHIRRSHFANYTGLVFTGYGDTEMFPRLISFQVEGTIEGKLRYVEEEHRKVIIPESADAAVCPFAQTDVIRTIIEGVDRPILQMANNTMEESIEFFKSQIGRIPGIPQAAVDEINKLNIEESLDFHRQTLEQYIQDQYINPAMMGVAHLSKEDIAEMAESLVSLTYLKKRFSGLPENVGLPVDVAVITKGDGFVWIKRKNYFDSKINPLFVQKYLK